MRLPFNGNYPITQTFGNVLFINGVNIYAQYGYKGHNGIDYGLPNDTPLVAPHNGYVKIAEYDKTGYGYNEVIENNIESSRLAHMRRFTVKVGDYVNEGDLIGYSNNSGMSTGPHLHHGYFRFPRNVNNGYNGYIDQTPYISYVTEIDMLISDFLKSVGYTDTSRFLDVVKAMYESDKKLKSGTLIQRTDCDAEKIGLETKLNKEKAEELIENEKICQENQKKAIENAINDYKKVNNLVSLSQKAQEYDQFKLTTGYSLGVFINNLFRFNTINKK